MKNNNQQITRLLASRLYTSNRRYNRILTVAVAISLFLLFSIFSIVIGRIQAQKLMFTRMAGTAATTFLEDATKKQADQIHELRYINTVGMEYILGGVYYESKEIGIRIYTEQSTFNSILKPAYTQIHGTYPARKGEIMLARRTLKKMGIQNPNTGMDIIITDQTGTKESFTLSGYYTEFMDEDSLPYAFFSKDYYESLPSYKYHTLLGIRQKDWYHGEAIEDMLYRDIPTIDKAQQFIGGDSVGYAAVVDLVGGIDIGLCFAVLIVLCSGMLIYNVIFLSLQRDIRQFGLLKTLGTTSKQIHRIVLRQVANILLIGLTAGTIAGCTFTLGILPRLLAGRYLKGFGNSSAIIHFQPLLLSFSILLVIIITLSSSLMPVHKVGKMDPVNALHYLDKNPRTGRKIQKSSKGNSIAIIAWRNIFRNKRNAIITLFSLILGFTVTLGGMVIIYGMDYGNQLKYDSDFLLSANNFPFLDDEYEEPNIYFDSSFLSRLEQLDGIHEIICSTGGYVALNSDDTVWSPLLIGNRLADGMQKDEEERTFATHVRKQYMAAFTVVDDTFLDALSYCNDKHNLHLDIDKLRDGTGAAAFHFNELSRQLQQEAVMHIGEQFSLNSFSGQQLGSLQFCGYINRSQTDLPPCETEPSTSGYPTLVISQNALKHLELTSDIFAIQIQVDAKKEPELKWKLQNMITELQSNTQKKSAFSGYTMQAKSDVLAAAQKELLPIRILMYTVCALLICMGVFNYLNVTISSLENRRAEFALLNTLGMTGKQLRNMLILEGIFYSSLITIFLITAGSGVIWLLYRIARERIPYMPFQYPAVGLLSLLLIIYTGCICLPLLISHQSKGQTS